MRPRKDPTCQWALGFDRGLIAAMPSTQLAECAPTVAIRAQSEALALAAYSSLLLALRLNDARLYPRDHDFALTASGKRAPHLARSQASQAGPQSAASHPSTRLRVSVLTL